MEECYSDLLPELRRMLARVTERPLELSFDKIVQVLGRTGDPSADVACVALTQGLELPPLSDALRLEVAARIDSAIVYIRDLGDAPLEGQHGPEVLESIMTDYWEDVGRFEWIRHRLLKQVDDEFYGYGS